MASESTSYATVHLEEIRDLLGPNPNSQRRAGPWARPNEIFVRLADELASRIDDGAVALCEDLTAGADLQISGADLRWYVRDPETIMCGLCAIAYAHTAGLPAWCWACDSGPGLPQVFATAGPVLMVADICSSCIPASPGEPVRHRAGRGFRR